jgi:2-amino-4-hydroxy-6-hydroxymethyldihydropteridine diphosphokinase
MVGRTSSRAGLTPVVVALGSNLGDSTVQLTLAGEQLRRLAAGGFRLSSFYQTAPVDCPPGSPMFFNAVAMFQVPPGETPESLLDKLQALEKQFGRLPKKELNEPRPLDLDLIAFGEERRQTARLVLPHPRAHLRRFVLQPLAEIAPVYRLPGQALAVSELLATLPPD